MGDLTRSNRGEIYEKYAAMGTWVFVILTLIFVVLQFIGSGYLPSGDARRHVGMAFTDRSYQEVLVATPQYTMNHSPGWEWLLQVIQRNMGWSADALMSCSVGISMLAVLVAPLPWLRRPEAWLAALLGVLVTSPVFMARLTQARPYLITEAVVMAILFAWTTPTWRRNLGWKVVPTSIGIALSVWMHGAWYLWVLPLMAFFMAGWWRAGLWVSACTAIGGAVGACMTGHPIQFLGQALFIATSVKQEALPHGLLVPEFRPGDGHVTCLLMLGLVVVWRLQQVGLLGIYSTALNHTDTVKLKPTLPAAEELKQVENRQSASPGEHLQILGDPVACQIIICWILSFAADRFWMDWGLPAVLVWMTLQIQSGLDATHNYIQPPIRRIIRCIVLGLPLLLYSGHLASTFVAVLASDDIIDAKASHLKGWVPEPGGIFYAAQMDFFYNTFYHNPEAPWRYVLGMEPALMLEENRKIYRRIQMSGGEFSTYEPWISKMRLQDRLVVKSAAQPLLPHLEWQHGIGQLWIGRLPR